MNFAILLSKGKGVKLFLNPRAFQDIKMTDAQSFLFLKLWN